MKKVNMSVIVPLTILILLFIIYWYMQWKKKNTIIEKYEENEVHEEVVEGDDLDLIPQYPLIYLSVFTKNSFNEKEGIWKNLASNKHDFKFNKNIIFNPIKGITLNDNVLTGPLCSEIGIVYKENYTIVFTYILDIIEPDSFGGEHASLIKLFGNSENNNAIEIWIDKNSIVKNHGNVSGSFYVLYGGSEHTGKEDLKFFDLNPDKLTTFFITKDGTEFKIYVKQENPDEGKEPINVVNLSTNVTNENITFSNKELVINRNGNLKADIVNLAIYNRRFSIDDMNDYSNQLYLLYMRNIDPNHHVLASKYNLLINKYKRATACPYDTETCQSCKGVDWSNQSTIIDTSLKCKEKINNYCSVNKDDPGCYCWTDDNKTREACTLFKRIFNKNFDIYSNLTQEELNKIKKAYQLVEMKKVTERLEQVDSSMLDRSLLGDFSKANQIATDDNRIINFYEDKLMGDDEIYYKKLTEDGLDYRENLQRPDLSIGQTETKEKLKEEEKKEKEIEQAEKEKEAKDSWNVFVWLKNLIF